MNSKRLFLFVSLLLVATAIVFAGGQREAAPAAPTAPTDEFDWRRYAGTTVVFNFPNHVHYNAMMEAGVIQEFEELTGITVEVDRMQYLNMHDSQVLEMSRAQGDYDLISMVVMWKAEYALGGMIQPLQPFFDNPALAVPGYDFDDLVPGYVEVTGIAGGDYIYRDGPGAELFGVPFGAETSFLVYRTDIFDEYNIPVPQTYDELTEAARRVYEEVPGVYGLTMRAASGHHATHAWLLHASPFGARVFDDNWEPVVNSPEAIEAIEFMKTMLEYGPPGMVGFTQDEEFAAFLQGDAAIYLDASVFAGPAKNPRVSTVYDRIGFGLHPSARTPLSQTGGFGIAIPANSRNPEAAFLLMQFLTMKETEEKIIRAGGAPFRMSSLNNPALQAEYPEFVVLAEQLKVANPDWRPIIPEWGEINNMLGIAINQALTGDKTPQQAMDDVMGPIRQVMVRAGYLSR
ncbi:MAG: extracellular solute-binding protein [Spirochaetaceae bacterium]|nr:MAG: extracellular solute-binding protein [Spirochaetaceae bacterium]